MKHKHAELIHAWADGAVIERLWSDPHYNDKAWLIDKEPMWEEYCEYRIKPEPKPDVVKYVMFNTETREPFLVSMVKADSFLFQSKVLMVRMDGETGELKSAEVLK